MREVPRKIGQSNQFKRDLKRELSGRYGKVLKSLLGELIEILVNDETIPPKMVDHPLTGNWNGFRDCHLKPDLVLIYSKSDQDSLHLVRLGSHSELGI